MPTPSEQAEGRCFIKDRLELERQQKEQGITFTLRKKMGLGLFTEIREN